MNPSGNLFDATSNTVGPNNENFDNEPSPLRASSHPPTETGQTGGGGSSLSECLQVKDGYVHIYRRLSGHPIMRDHTCLTLFIHILLEAEWKPGRKVYCGTKEIELKSGQVVIGRYAISEVLGMNPNTVKACLERLSKKYEIITTTATNRFTIVTICNYDRYQFKENRKTQSNTTIDTTTDTTPRVFNNLSINNNNNILSNKDIGADAPKQAPENKIPPTLESVQTYMDTLGYPQEAEKFYDHFSANGWKVGGKTPMKNWQAACRNWTRKSRENMYKTGLGPDGKYYTKAQLATMESLAELTRKTDESRNLAKSDTRVINLFPEQKDGRSGSA